MNKKPDSQLIEKDESEGAYSRWYRRWSKRKIQTQNNIVTDSVATEKQTEQSSLFMPSADALALSESGQEPVVLRDEDMPDLETLNEDSDYSGFLSPGVSEQLRQLALRKLFHGNSFNLCDGLDDYDEEFSSFEKLGDIVTADMRFQLEQEARKKMQIASENEALTENLTEKIAEEPDEITQLNDEYTDNSADESVSYESIEEAFMDETGDNDMKKNREGNTLSENENLS